MLIIIYFSKLIYYFSFPATRRYISGAWRRLHRTIMSSLPRPRLLLRKGILCCQDCWWNSKLLFSGSWINTYLAKIVKYIWNLIPKKTHLQSSLSVWTLSLRFEVGIYFIHFVLKNLLVSLMKWMRILTFTV